MWFDAEEVEEVVEEEYNDDDDDGEDISFMGNDDEDKSLAWNNKSL